MKILTFRKSLLILAGGLMFTACKKEEVKKENLKTNQEIIHNKNIPIWPVDILPYYELINSNVNIDGITYRQYMNTYDSTYVYFEKYPNQSTKSIFQLYKWDAYYIDIHGLNGVIRRQLMCGGEALGECRNTIFGILVKYGASLE